MIRVSDLIIRSGDFSLENVSFEVPGGAHAALMGRTGSGKTSILETIAGLRSLASGRIELAGRDVTHLRPADRNIGYVPQDAALFSTMTVARQVGFALEVRGARQTAIDARVAELAALLGIGHLLARRPRGLSGGEAQRVSLGRALAHAPPVLLLDEPLSALDDQTRQEMFSLLRRVREKTGVTVLHVTHNAEEARALADIVLQIADGELRVVNRGELTPLGGSRAFIDPTRAGDAG